MAWKMPPETATVERVWMAFPCANVMLGEKPEEAETAYETWTAVAHAAAEFAAVSMLVDPSETQRARRMLGTHVEQLECPLDDFWLRDTGPTFVLDDERPGVLGAVDWEFNGYGAQHWAASWEHDRAVAGFVAAATAAEPVGSSLVNEGGGIHTDGAGTLLATETVQLDPDRNPGVDKQEVEAEFRRTLGIEKVIWVRRGLTRDYEDLGTRGHVDMVTSFLSPGRVLLHDQRDAGHPDHAVTREVRSLLEAETDAAGDRFEIVDLPAPDTLRDEAGFVDWSYVNHLVVNDGVVACAFGDRRADEAAAAILAEQYSADRVIPIDARPIFSRGGGIHCITQNQPALGEAAR